MKEAKDDSDDQSSPAIGPKRSSLTTEYLANERTYLAWIRTSLALTGFGFAVAKFGSWLRALSMQPAAGADASPSSSRSTIIGMIMIAMGGCFAVMAAWRHRVVNRQIETGMVRPADKSILFVTVVLLLLAAAVFYVLVNGH